MKGLNIFLCCDSTNFIAHFASYRSLTSSVLFLDRSGSVMVLPDGGGWIPVGLLAPCGLWPAVAYWGFGIGSGFRVGWCVAGEV